MHVVYSASDSFCEIAGISILSLLESNKEVDEIHLYVIDNNISSANKEKLNRLVESYGRQIQYLELLDIEAKAQVKINIGRWNISTFCRLFLCSLLPGSVGRVLFMDCDTLVLQPLDELWNMDMQGAWVCGVDDCRNANYRTNLGLEPAANYINNGVLLIDLNAWRENDVEQQFIEYIQTYNGDITYVDQGVQNGVLSRQNRSGIIHPRYNCLTVFFDFTYKSLVKFRKPPVIYDPVIYREATENPVIVHFQSCFRSGIRPWNPGYKHPFALLYLQYKAKSPWADEPMRPDDRTFAQKTLTAVSRMMPEFIMVNLISVLHTQIYPIMRNLKKPKRISL